MIYQPIIAPTGLLRDIMKNFDNANDYVAGYEYRVSLGKKDIPTMTIPILKHTYVDVACKAYTYDPDKGEQVYLVTPLILHRGSFSEAPKEFIGLLNVLKTCWDVEEAEHSLTLLTPPVKATEFWDTFIDAHASHDDKVDAFNRGYLRRGDPLLLGNFTK